MISTGAALQNKYKEWIMSRDFLSLDRHIKKTDTPPSENIVRMGFKTYLSQQTGIKVKLFSVMKLKEITKVKPEGEVLKELCEIALGMDSPLVLEAMIKRIEADKRIFGEMNASLQKVYNHYINEGRFKDLATMMDVTDTKPTEDLVHKGYEMYLINARFISFTGLKKQTKIKPDKDMVQQVYYQYYSEYLKSKNRSDDDTRTWHRRLKKLQKITRIRPPDDIEVEDPPPAEDEY